MEKKKEKLMVILLLFIFFILPPTTCMHAHDYDIFSGIFFSRKHMLLTYVNLKMICRIKALYTSFSMPRVWMC